MALGEGLQSFRRFGIVVVVDPLFQHQVHGPDRPLGTVVNARAANEAGLPPASPPCLLLVARTK